MNIRKKPILIAAGVAVVLGAAIAATGTWAGGDRHSMHGMWHKAGFGGYGKHQGHMQMMQELDPEGTGKIDLKAFEQKRRDRFRNFDGDGDGKLSLGEYEGLWREAMHRQMVRRFQSHDRDGDGVISETDFLDPMQRMLSFVDRNGDGVIERSEMRRRHGDDDD